LGLQEIEWVILGGFGLPAKGWIEKARSARRCVCRQGDWLVMN